MHGFHTIIGFPKLEAYGERKFLFKFALQYPHSDPQRFCVDHSGWLTHKGTHGSAVNAPAK